MLNNNTNLFIYIGQLLTVLRQDYIRAEIVQQKIFNEINASVQIITKSLHKIA